MMGVDLVRPNLEDMPYLRRIVDTDLVGMRQAGRRPQLLRRWMGAYTTAMVMTTTYETIRDAAPPG